MRIVRKSFEHSSMGTEWECEDLRITIKFDEGELHEPRLYKRFALVEINQRYYKGEHPSSMGTKTWMKGCHSAWFGEEQIKTDKEKKYIWDLLHRFMKDNLNAISVNWKL